MKRTIAAIAITTAMAAMQPAVSHADTYCTPDTPYPPYGGVCTGGYGNYCYISPGCSTVSGMPGTLNPGGYTPPVPSQVPRYNPFNPIHNPFMS